MRRFNPEKELKKIQKGNKNKVIISVCLLLLIIAIGSSYALYQIRYSKQIIYTTVAPFYSKDIQLAVYVDGIKKEEFPSKTEGYLYENIECENEDISASFNNDTWKLNLEVGKPNKCNIKFTSSPFKADICKDTPMSECLLKEELQYNQELAYDDPAGNARYIGATPSNYIWFNCLKYDDLTNDNAENDQHQCEKWQIIGSFKNMIIADDKVNTDNPTKENLIKIVRADIIGGLLWDNANTNNWNNASLKLLLENYYNGNELNGCADQTCSGNTIIIKGITDKTKGMIEKVTWNLGGHNTYNATAQTFYIAERGSTLPSGAQSKYDGYIGLIYPSDYGYATNGGGSLDRTACLTTNLVNYANVCNPKDWIYISRINQLTLTPDSSNSLYAFVVNWRGAIDYVSANFASAVVRPSLYLNSSVKIINGDGSIDSPYIIAPQ